LMIFASAKAAALLACDATPLRARRRTTGRLTKRAAHPLYADQAALAACAACATPAEHPHAAAWHWGSGVNKTNAFDIIRV
jgi:hypothetical protein